MGEKAKSAFEFLGWREGSAYFANPEGHVFLAGMTPEEIRRNNEIKALPHFQQAATRPTKKLDLSTLSSDQKWLKDKEPRHETFVPDERTPGVGN